MVTGTNDRPPPPSHLMLRVDSKDILRYSPMAGLLMFHNMYISNGQGFSA